MFKTLLLILFVFGSLCFAQGESPNREMPVAKKVAGFETAANGYVKMSMDSYFVELNSNPSAQGFIVNYGLPRELSKRRLQIMNSIRFRKYDSSRITIVDGGFRPKIKTEFWLVPSGAEPPKLQNIAELFDELEKATIEDVKARTDFLFVKLNEDLSSQGYILNYGTEKQIALREKLIKQEIAFRRYDSTRVIFVNAGTNKTIKTQFWIDKKTP